MQIEEFLENSARSYAKKTALVCANHRLTYREMEAAANSLANYLIGAGVQRWDRVAVYLENCAAAAVAIFAALKAGAVFVIIDPTTKAEKLAFILNNCRASALITSQDKLPRLAGRWADLPDLRTCVVAGDPSLCLPRGPQTFACLQQVLTAESDRRPAKKCIDVDLAALIYTSGSTGRPKGVMMTHLNIVSAATSITTYLENTPADIIFNVLPLAFDYGLYQLLMAFKIGATLVLESSFTYPYKVVETIVREHVTGLPLVPTICAILLQMDLSKYDFSRLRYITNTAAALPTEHIGRLRQLFPRVKIYSMYGLTECKRVSYLPPEQLEVRPSSVGKAIPNEEVYVVDELGNRVAPGEVGQLVVRGSNVMQGYWELPDETDKALRPGPFPGEKVLYTGDLFKTDAEGYLYFVGRTDDIIKSRGEKVSPREVENVLYALPGVAEAAVIGVSDPVLGNAIKAIISLKSEARLTQQDVVRFCADRLQDFMVPKVVEFLPALPKSSNGKIDKRALAAAGGIL